MTENDIESLKGISKEIRKSIIEEVYSAQSGHPGGALSATEILTVLYFNQMNIDPERPDDENRDRFVLSKGHASAGLYATLAERGFFDKSELKNFRKLGSMLQGHPDMKHIPGVDMTTGSLGQGLSAANGMAMASKIDKRGFRVYCLVGDGEIEEGQIWEAAMTSSHYKLDNLCLIIDNNNLQIDGKVTEVMSIYPLKEKLQSFGFEVFEVDGNNIDELITVFQKAKTIKEKPTAVIAKTIKGKGVDFMENQVSWHGKAPKEEEYKLAMEELNK
ncbi:MAG: transketolase [Clostridia bacterium]|nr:transketolase [Clostridia bacterium]